MVLTEEEKKKKKREYYLKWISIPENKEKIKESRKEYYTQNLVKIKIKQKEYRDREENKIEQKEYMVEYNIRNEEKEKNRHKEYRDIEENKIKHNEYMIGYNIENRESLKIKRRTFFIQNRERMNKQKNEYIRSLYYTNTRFRIKRCISRRITQALKYQQLGKEYPTISYLGCSIPFLKQHLEKKFKEGMSWENHVFYGWHIDHIKPCIKFDLTKEEEQKKCFHYTNLQPLWAWENYSKGAKYEEELIC